jgi:hypothetical protein
LGKAGRSSLEGRGSDLYSLEGGTGIGSPLEEGTCPRLLGSGAHGRSPGSVHRFRFKFSAVVEAVGESGGPFG